MKKSKSVNKWGYPSEKQCEVCGKHNNNQQEPRFGYTVCIEHQSVPPAEIHTRSIGMSPEMAAPYGQ